MPRSGIALDRRDAGGGSGRLVPSLSEGAGGLGRLCALFSLALVIGTGSPDAAGQVAVARVERVADTATIETVAGGGPLGDGEPALSARFNLPGGVLEAPNGDLVVIDFGNHRVRRIDKNTGIIETIVGTGEAGYNGDGIPARQAQLARPEYAMFGPTGDLYIADSYNNRVRKVDHATGLISTVAGTGERGFSGD